MTSGFHEVVFDVVRRSSTDLFKSVGLDMKLQGETSLTIGDLHVGGVVRFTGDQVRGSLAVVSTFDFIARSRPAELRKVALSSRRASDWVMVRDWAAELANQLVGRMKNRVSVPLVVSPPLALSGQALIIALPRGDRTRSIALAQANDVVHVRIELDADPSIAVRPEAEVPGHAREGDVILF